MAGYLATLRGLTRRSRDGSALAARLLGFVAVFLAGSATAQEEMTFEFATNGGRCLDCRWIAADGVITKNTPDAFRAYMAADTGRGLIRFNSAGGDLGAAVELGRLIREAGLGTAVGETMVPEETFGQDVRVTGPGVCASACAFAFMGGTRRTVTDFVLWEEPDNRLGMHRFFRRDGREIPTAATQRLVGELLIYVLDMGIDPKVLELASRAGATEMYEFSQEELNALGLQTGQGRTPMTLVLERDGLALTWDALGFDGRLARRATLYCDAAERSWMLRVEEHEWGWGPLGFEPESPAVMRISVGERAVPLQAGHIRHLAQTDDVWTIVVRLPVELRDHPGQPFDFRTSDFTQWTWHLSAQGQVPGPGRLALLQRACVS